MQYFIWRNNIMEKIIHQVWFSPLETMPPKYIEYVQSWKIKNPDYTYMLWNKEQSRTLIKSNYEWFLKTYDDYEYEIQRIDTCRYFILYHYGGIYADIDALCLTGIDEALKNDKHDVLFIECSKQNNKSSTRNDVSNFLMISKTKQHKFWNDIFHALIKKSTPWFCYGKTLKVMFSTGPEMIDSVFLNTMLSNVRSISENSVGSISQDNFIIHDGDSHWVGYDNYIIFKMLLPVYRFLYSKIVGFTTTPCIKN